MFSFSVQIPKFGRRSSQPPRERRATLSELAVVPAGSSRSRSFAPAPRLFVVESEDGPELPDSGLAPHVVDVAPRSASRPRPERYSSLPAAVQPEMIEISPRRGRLTRREDSLPTLPAIELPHASTFIGGDYHAAYDWLPRREVSSDPRGRRLIVERSTSRQPRLLAEAPSRDRSSARSASRSSRPRSAAPVIHQAPERARSSHRRSLSRQSRISERSSCSCSCSSAASDAGTATTAPSVRGSPETLAKFQHRLDKLDTVDEPVREGSPPPKPKATRRKYRYIPLEDDVSSVKSFVREMERGRSRSARPAAESVAGSSDKSASSDAASRAGTEDAEPGAESVPPPLLPRRAHGRSVSYGNVGTPARSSSAARTARSLSTAPSVARRSSVAPSVTRSIPAAPSPPRAVRPKFAERFSVCLDDSTETYCPSESAASSTQDSPDHRRVRRMRRVMKMAEYAAGRR